MGSLTLPAEGVPYLDTNGFIYSVERVTPFAALLDPLWQALRAQSRYLITSEITLLETLVRPLQIQDQVLEASFRAILLTAPEVRLAPITRTILTRAANVRATTGLKNPDALHAATALDTGCAMFITNDASFRRITGLNVVLLSQLLTP
ncbi:MAG TPA: PIN domain-containing protein [Ktedonobacterales bacterium]